MKWFYNLKISMKLLTGFIFVALIAGVVGVVGIVNIRNINQSYTDLYLEYGIALGDIQNVAVSNQIIRGAYRDAVMQEDTSNIEQYVNLINEHDNIIGENLAEFEEYINDAEVQRDFDELVSNMERFNPIRDNIVNLALEGENEQAIELMEGEAVALAEGVQERIDGLVNMKTEEGEIISAELTSTTNDTITAMIMIIAGAMIFAIILGIFISNIISKPVKKMVKAADKLAVGDVEVEIDSNTKDEIGSLMKSFGNMIENIREQAFTVERMADGDLTVELKVKSDKDILGKNINEMLRANNEILSNISSASDQVAAGSNQVSSSSQLLSQGATEQASSIEEVTTSIDQVATQTKQNAANANRANDLALAAKEDAIEGNGQMDGMLNAMSDINESSSNISKIIKVIDEIAFQTNILALNAAVEAARAGQHGKGFAVVAEEVRNLAARSANAAKETTEMIEGCISKVGTGTKIANDTSEALKKIVEGVTKAVDLVGEITQASNEQATGISQVNQAVSEVSQVVQTNSATAEESASASEELSSQAELLKESVRKFKLKETSNFSNGNPINSDMINMLEDMIEKKTSFKNEQKGTNYEKKNLEDSSHIPATSEISLDEKEYGKY
ncbi:methyl-accepting chemotaxis protein [Herbivorax sp. ANBcel31]|uniref:methyl-accepting chemotaxis protein n=1 Tax=Herbivorax sp. ANBcel31 TaxID=3069754 RepID=UPI0027B3D982|nr:methyl-accepting chemotaxis protein [Herbivorax sp. ANBcel31]MDQ2084845.1 methyl-accepting chemotaxis protein [Herbivorax sp. ANBcel31]